jgi:hypothetical protein
MWYISRKIDKIARKFLVNLYKAKAMSEEEKLPEPEFDLIYEVQASEYISSAYYAICAVDGIDTALMSKDEAKKIKLIKDLNLEIIYHYTIKNYNEIFQINDCGDIAE